MLDPHRFPANKAAHDTYNVSERHKKFGEENHPSFKKVRVFDSVREPYFSNR